MREPAIDLLAARRQGRQPTRLSSMLTWVATGLAVAGLGYWAFRDVRVAETVKVLGRLHLWQILVLIGLNVAMYSLMSLRWWLIARADLVNASYIEMGLVRAAAFSLSYLTPGPQLGGEPLQVLYLRRRANATIARATATVVLDHLLELLALFLFLAVGVASFVVAGARGSLTSISPWPLVALGLGLLWPPLHIALLRVGRYPVSALVRPLQAIRPLKHVLRLTRAAEHLAGRFCQRRPAALLAGIGTSLLCCLILVLEYQLITSFLGLGLRPEQTLAGWTAAVLPFALPLPAGLGALEAAQVLALGAMGVTPPLAIAVAVLLRTRDLLFGGLGALVGATAVRRLLIQGKGPL